MARKPQIIKMSHLSNLFYTFNAIPVKIQTSYFINIVKLILIFLWRDTILNEKKKLED